MKFIFIPDLNTSVSSDWFVSDTCAIFIQAYATSHILEIPGLYHACMHKYLTYSCVSCSARLAFYAAYNNLQKGDVMQLNTKQSYQGFLITAFPKIFYVSYTSETVHGYNFQFINGWQVVCYFLVTFNIVEMSLFLLSFTI